MQYKYTRTINTFNDLFEIYEDARDNKALACVGAIFETSDYVLVIDDFIEEEIMNDVLVRYRLIGLYDYSFITVKLPIHNFYDTLKLLFGEVIEVKSNKEWFSFESYSMED